MNIQDINNLLAIKNEGSFNKASKKLYISQPALSKCVKKIEMEFGIVLFNRIPGEHSISLTREGEVFYEYIEFLNARHIDFLARLREVKEKNHSIIVLGISPRTSQLLSPQLLKWFNDVHPEYFLRIREEDTAQLEKDLESGAIDFAYVSYQKLNSSNICYDTIVQQNWYIYLRKDSPAMHHAVLNDGRQYLSLRDLADEPFSTSSPDHRSTQLINLMEEKAGITLKKRIENNPLNRFQLAERGICSCFTMLMDTSVYEYDEKRIFRIADTDHIPIRRTLAYLPQMKYSEKRKLLAEGFTHLLAQNDQ